jgi:hypothetical protein
MNEPTTKVNEEGKTVKEVLGETGNLDLQLFLTEVWLSGSRGNLHPI